jgi:DNA invertase Pin-like site-specific DNA recombinase
MQIGYARSSTLDQEAGYQAQIKALKEAGCEKGLPRRCRQWQSGCNSTPLSTMRGKVMR